MKGKEKKDTKGSFSSGSGKEGRRLDAYSHGQEEMGDEDPSLKGRDYPYPLKEKRRERRQAELLQG